MADLCSKLYLRKQLIFQDMTVYLGSKSGLPPIQVTV